MTSILILRIIIWTHKLCQAPLLHNCLIIEQYCKTRGEEHILIAASERSGCGLPVVNTSFNLEFWMDCILISTSQSIIMCATIMKWALKSGF